VTAEGAFTADVAVGGTIEAVASRSDAGVADRSWQTETWER